MVKAVLLSLWMFLFILIWTFLWLTLMQWIAPRAEASVPRRTVHEVHVDMIEFNVWGVNGTPMGQVIGWNYKWDPTRQYDSVAPTLRPVPEWYYTWNPQHTKRFAPVYHPSRDRFIWYHYTNRGRTLKVVAKVFIRTATHTDPEMTVRRHNDFMGIQKGPSSVALEGPVDFRNVKKDGLEVLE